VPLADKAVYFCNVHLPSDKQMGAKEADERRIREVRAILGLDPHPDVVLGDLNEEPDGALGGVLGEAGYVDAAAHVDSAGQMTTLDGHRKDQIWVREELATRLSGYGLLGRQQLETDLPEKKYLSDHLGVYIEIDL
jgi:endonuclease/exonuclease/phosphatase family metal-dependent hydrolase